MKYCLTNIFVNRANLHLFLKSEVSPTGSLLNYPPAGSCATFRRWGLAGGEGLWGKLLKVIDWPLVLAYSVLDLLRWEELPSDSLLCRAENL